MPNLEHQLQRYGDLLDGVTDQTSEHTELVTAARPRRAIRTTLVAVAMVVVVSIIAVAAGLRATHGPAPATVPIVTPTTTTTEATTTSTTIATGQAQAERDRAQAEAWIREHAGQPVDIHDAGNIAMTDRAVYVLSVSNDATSPPPTLWRVDRQSRRFVSVAEAGAVEISVGGTALYLVTGRPAQSNIERLDPDTLQPLWTTPLADPTASFGAQVAGNAGTVWVVLGHELRRLDATTGRVVQSITLARTNEPDVSASIALDPTGSSLYVVYGQGGGASEPLERRDARTGAVFDVNMHGPGGLGAPQLAATSDGVWVAYRTGMNGEASFFRAADLARDGELLVSGDSGFAMGVELAYGGTVLWAGNSEFLACADARSGRGLDTLHSDGDSNLNVFGVAADTTGVAISVDGTLGIFQPGDLCPQAK